MIARNLEERCIWKLTKLPVPTCQKCDGYDDACPDYLTYNQSKSVGSLVERYEQLIRREKNG
jgi:hypothetical protein